MLNHLPVDPAMIDAYTSASLRNEVGTPENWLLQKAQGVALAPSTLTTFRTIDLLVRHRQIMGTLWNESSWVDPMPSPEIDRNGSTPVMSDPTDILVTDLEPKLGILEDLAWLHAHQLEPLGLLDIRGGGMGAIALAWHAGMKREIILKVASKPHLRQRFHREIEVHAKIGGHPNLVVARSPLVHRGLSVLVIDYVRGLSLSRWIKLYGPMPWPEAAGCVRQAALGLGHAHAKGVIHRDVKPSNLVRSSNDGVVSVIDWGLALDRERKDHDDHDLTRTGQFLGTPLYCPPEQAIAPSGAVPASDLYGLGCVWYELMTGKPPFPPGRGKLPDHHRLRTAHAKTPVPALAPELGVPEGVEHVLRKLLNKNPDRRYPTAEAFITDLDKARNQGVVVPVKNLWPRRLVLVAIAATLLLGWLGWSKIRGPAQIREVVIKVFSPGGQPGKTGILGSEVFEAFLGDEVTIQGDLTAPGYVYLIAFRPDGQMELFSTAGEAAVPDRVGSPSYPPAGQQSVVIKLNEGEGLQAFALVLSRTPLPSFRDWRASQGAPPWRSVKKVAPGIVWRSDGQTLEMLRPKGSGETRGTGSSQGARGAVVEIAEWLKARPGVDQVVVKGFAVLPAETD